MKIFTNVAALKAATLTAGQLVETKGYYDAGDGGQARYLIQTAVGYGATPDEYGNHTLANGTVAVLQYEGVVNVRWFGARGDNSTIDTAAIAAAITAAGADGAIYFPIGVYLFHDHNADGFGLIQLTGQTWSGDGHASVLRLAPSVTTINVGVVTADFATDYSIKDMQIDGNRSNITPATDLYSTFYLIRGAAEGKRGTYKRLLLSNSWGRVLQTSNESAPGYAEDILVDDVRVINAGTKGISATKSKRVTIANSFVEVNPYTSTDHPFVFDTGNAVSGSCFEVNDSKDVSIVGNHGVQVGSVVAAPGIRFINSSERVTASNNTIENASYFGFFQNVNNIDFFGNIGINTRGNAFLIADDDVSEPTTPCLRIRIHHNKVIDADTAFVLTAAKKAGFDSFVEAYIYNNEFIKPSGGNASRVFFNEGVTGGATGGSCLVYQWDNVVPATIPLRDGLAASEVLIKPNSGWTIFEQSSVPSSVTGTTVETNLAVITLPGRSLGKNGRARITAQFSFPNNVNNKITRIRFGGLLANAATITTATQQRVQIEVCNRNDESAQISGIQGTNYGFGLSGSAVTTMAVDTTVNTSIALSGQLGNSADSITLESYLIENFYAD